MTQLKKPNRYENLDQAVEHILKILGSDIRLGLPLGLGKPAQLTNALYSRAKQNPDIQLTIYTALTLERPNLGKGLKRRFLEPYFERVFEGYVELDYIKDIRLNQVPDNVQIHEFFFQSGSMLDTEQAQQDYMSSNYTHVCRDLAKRGVNLLAQMIAVDDQGQVPRYSLSCNPEISLDLIPLLHCRSERPFLLVGQVNRQLPFMPNDAEFDVNQLDILIDSQQYESTLFAVPNLPINTIDYVIGLYAASLIPDGGTLQIGIGSLGDAVSYGCILRHQHNAQFREIHQQLGTETEFSSIIQDCGDLRPFRQGLYGNSEMFVNGFLQLIEAGILSRRVYNHPDLQRLLNTGELQEPLDATSLLTLHEAGIIQNPLTDSDIHFLCWYGFFKPDIRLNPDGQIQAEDQLIRNSLLTEIDSIRNFCMGQELNHGHILDAGFFLGPKDFYQALRELDSKTLNSINMTHISFVNHLYSNEILKRLQRHKARYINTVFKASALGAATSDALENGQVVSGVGGQYNFVAQAHELDDARSILLLRSTRNSQGNCSSNVVWRYGHTTIPRHLRDIYVTEYGIADVRGCSDQEVVAAMIQISDSRFQNQLRRQAVSAGKLPASYQIPERFCNNRPERLEQMLTSWKKKGFFPQFPFGTDMTEEEQTLAQCLQELQSLRNNKLALAAALFPPVKERLEHRPYLERLQLRSPQSIKDRITKQLLQKVLDSKFRTDQ